MNHFFFLVKYLNVQSPKHSTFPLEPLYGELTVSPFWANGECTLSQQWAHSEPTVNAYEQWMMSKRRAQTQTQRNNERIVMWAQDERFIWCVSGVVLTLCFVSYKKKKGCIVMSLNIILFDWTISEHWTKVSAK